ncbi:hypothetical protein KEM60_00125 [Austwickia sp. TVS 96-490-7B]|uniref:AlbA family DNA-binding domain-containing protein n=1 Tax=Austwickia sp. TVS 96-490-7B TaxID=2830843 RepID=UPI001C564A49|nr:ATP-binding protein [Austwickia sp. TVS 96-490-7B]MBW3083943.1 hypothetical protein [Austwickia sp. TVS 96-490-7B]
MSYYLGPGRPLTSLSTWQELKAAAAGGLLSETQWCEVKEMPSQSSKASNVELAKDLASLSVDGGLLVYGVADKSFEVVGCDLTNFETRISQVAATRVTPPLSPVLNPPIPCPDDDGKHVLIVSVPASPVAPHMVDGSYWGRSSDGKRKLADPEVRRLIQARENAEEKFGQILDDLVRNDPLDDFVEDMPTGNGHVYFVAQPCAPVLAKPIEMDELRNVLANLRQSPSYELLAGCTYNAHDPSGVGLRSHTDAVSASDERDLAQVGIADNFIVKAVYGGASTHRTCPSGPGFYVPINSVVAFVAQCLNLVHHVGTSTGYQGEWRVGVHLTHLRGASLNSDDISFQPVPLRTDELRRVEVIQPTSWTDPGADAGDQAVILLRGLLRGLNIPNEKYVDLVHRSY